MSEKYADNNIKQTSRSLGQVSTMGNLFSKEDPEGQECQKKALPDEETRPKCSPPNPLLADQEHFLKFFDKAAPQESLLSAVKEPQVLDSEKVILNAFLNEVRNAKPAPLKNWSALQHYVYFIYRHVISEKPCNSNEIFPNVITKKIRDLMESLLQEDVVQLCIRLVTLVREYAIIARGHFDSLQHPKVTAYLVSLMSYYSAFCSAASKLAPLLPEFDFLIMERFNVNWLCLNKSIFYHYVYMSPAVQHKIPVFLKLKEENKSVHKNLLESYNCFSEDMSLIATRWSHLRMRICTLTHKRALHNPEKYLLSDWRMFEQHKKILETNYWMVRNTHIMQIQDMTELDAHILSIVGDTAYIADFLIDSQGHCMCEDCLAAEFRCTTMNTVIPSSFQAQSSATCRLITCYICQDPIALDALASHIVTKHHDSQLHKASRVFLTPHQKRFPKKSSKGGDLGKPREPFPFEGLFEKNLELKESILKLVNGRVPRGTPEGAEKEGQNTTFKIEEAANFRTDTKDPEFQLPKKVPVEPVINSIATEELKHKPASTSRVAEPSFPVKSSASPIFQSPNVPLKTTKEPVFKIASEAPVMQNGNEIMFKGASKSNEEMQSCKAALDEFLKQRNETTDNTQPGKKVVNDSSKWKSTDVANKKATEVLMKSAELFSGKDVPKTVGEKTSGEVVGKKTNFIALASTNTFVNSTANENNTFRKPQQKGISNLDQKMLEFLKNANTQKSTTSAATKPSDTCAGHACGHKCKQEDDKQAELKKSSCQDTCEHHKESRKCDCAYCEVFGASLPSHTHKTNETRDRLRSRLNQRKEKVNEGANKSIPKASPLNAKLTSAKSNGSLNCTIKITGSSKISMLNGKTLNVSATSNAKVNIKPVVNDTDMHVPPRVPEVVHPVPPPPAVKPVVATPAPKKSPPPIKEEIPVNDVQKVPVSRSAPLSSGLEKPVNDSEALHGPLSVSTVSLDSFLVDSRDINELLNYIEGNKPVDKAALAEKKAAKKSRQRIKKAQEREVLEKEKRLIEQARIRDERRKEEARLKAELYALQLAEKQRRHKREQEQEHKAQLKRAEAKKASKKKAKNNNDSTSIKETEKRPSLIEETIPAMVTIKRVAEGSNSPATVTITLKGSTPESDKLLFTLVNGHNNKEQVATATLKSKSDSTIKIRPQSTTTKIDSDSQKNGKKKKQKETCEVASKELKVTIAVDKNNVNKKGVSNKKNTKPNEIPKVPETKVFNKNSKEAAKPVNNIRDDINLPMLRLPPGITITKIEGPPTNRNCKVSNGTNNVPQNSQNQNVPVSKSGVIVVDTEKLIQQSITASNNKKNKKKNKKKRDQKGGNSEGDTPFVDKGSKSSGSSMVTLKNPIFHTLQTALSNKVTENADMPAFSNNQQASIFKNENGMVTIRSPRLQNSYENGSSISNFLSDLKPMFGPEVSAPYVPMCHTNFPEGNKHASFNAQEILSGLPGIEITKVDKSAPKVEPENKKASQAAEVSIIPTSNGANGADKFNFDRDDWPFESVFTPRDVLEEDMDAEERELEAFKRFCQQSIPPERKEKVAHLNVKDIILNKKRDVTYS